MHYMRLTPDIKIRFKPFVIHEHLTAKVETNNRELGQLKVIQRSTSNYSLSLVINRKKDESIRIFIDYRKLNEIKWQTQS